MNRSIGRTVRMPSSSSKYQYILYIGGPHHGRRIQVNTSRDTQVHQYQVGPEYQVVFYHKRIILVGCREEIVYVWAELPRDKIAPLYAEIVTNV
jgi:hypothetical protein